MARFSCFPGLISVSRTVVYCCSAFWLFGFLETRQIMGLRFLPFLAVSLLCWLLFHLFLRHPRPLPALVALGVCLWAVSSALLLWKCAVLTGIVPVLLSLIAVGVAIFRAAQVCIEPISAAKSISAMELCTLFFIVFLWLQGAIGIPASYSLPLLGASLLSLFSVLYQRLASVQNGNTSGRWLQGLIAVTALLLFIVGLLVLFFTYGADPLTHGILLLYSGLKFALSRLWGWFCAFLDWLTSFASGSAPQELPYEIAPSPTPELPAEPESEMGQIYLIFAAIGLCLLLALVIRIIWMLRSARVKGQPHSPVGQATAPRRGSLRRWLRRLWSRIAESLRLRLTILSMRGTPQELYYFLTRTGKRLGLRKAPGETPSAFLARAASLPSVQADPPLREALTELKATLQEALYAPNSSPALSPQHGHCIRRRFTRALWRARWVQLKALPARLRQDAANAKKSAAKQGSSFVKTLKKEQKNT